MLIRRQCDSRQNGHDCDHDHQFNKGKTRLFLHLKCPFILGSWEVPVENHPHVSILSELSGVATEIAVFVNHFSIIYQKHDINHKTRGF